MRVDALSSVSLCFSLLDGCFHMMPCRPSVMCQDCPVVFHSDVAVSRLVCFVVGYTFHRGFAHLSRSSREQNDKRWKVVQTEALNICLRVPAFHSQASHQPVCYLHFMLSG